MQFITLYIYYFFYNYYFCIHLYYYCKAIHTAIIWRLSRLISLYETLGFNLLRIHRISGYIEEPNGYLSRELAVHVGP